MVPKVRGHRPAIASPDPHALPAKPVPAQMLVAAPLRSAATAKAAPNALKAPSADIALAPQSFAVRGGKAIFVDIERTAAALSFDLGKKRVTGSATVVFVQPEVGFPLVDLKGKPKRVQIDGKSVAASDYSFVKTPDGTAQIRMLRQKLRPGRHEMRVDYELDPRAMKAWNAHAVQFDGFEFFTWMSDVHDGPNFFEIYGPANLEYDRHALSLEVTLIDVDREYEVISNGRARTVSTNTGSSTLIQFPETTTASSPFVHIVDKSLVRRSEQEYTSTGGQKIPVLVYGTQVDGKDYAARVLADLRRIEEALGPYPHPSFTAFIDPQMRGGMEYAGATRSGPYSLFHEMIHSWFARGVGPANGEAGWVDEAITTWLKSQLGGEAKTGAVYGILAQQQCPTLAPEGEYKRTTTMNAYPGSVLIQALDEVFANDGGMVPKLRTFFAEHTHRSISVAMFRAHLEKGATAEQRAMIAKLFAACGYPSGAG